MVNYHYLRGHAWSWGNQSVPDHYHRKEVKVDQAQVKFPDDNREDGRKHVEIQNVLIREGRGRKVFIRIMEMSESLKQFGMLQAIVISPHPTIEGKFYLEAGERRLRGAMIAGWKTVPYYLRSDLDPLSQKEIELEENVGRENLEFTEQIELQRQIHELKIAKYGQAPRIGTLGVTAETQTGWNQDKTAELFGISPQAISKNIILAKTLKERPDLLAMAKESGSVNVARRRVAHKLEVEAAEKKEKAGELKITQGFLNGDARELIKAVPSDSIGCIITDPPTGLETLTENEGKDRGESGSHQFTAMMAPEDNLDPVKAVQLVIDMSKEWFRVLKPGRHIYIFHSADNFGVLKKVMRDAGFEVQPHPLQWYKGRPTTSHEYFYTACMEPILVAIKPATNGGSKFKLTEQMRSMIEVKPVPVKERVHIFQKPLDLLTILLKQSSVVGDTIHDSFGGSASLLIAAIQSKRSALVFEKNKEHWLKAQVFMAANSVTVPTGTVEAKPS